MEGITQKKRIEIFCCYARADRKYLTQLKDHLALWERLGLLSFWHDGDISPGTDWRETILKNLHSAHIILLLISSDFLASDYCYSTELQVAMERYERGETRVIPIVLRPCAWEEAPFGSIQALPTNSEPVLGSSWSSPDEAFEKVARGIRQVVEDLRRAFPQAAETHEEARPEIHAATGGEKNNLDQDRSTELITSWVTTPSQPPTYENSDECQATGLVAWNNKKGDYVIWFDDSSELELQGNLMPGAYHFRFLKGAGTILAANAISDTELLASYFAKHGISVIPGITHEEQALQIYQKALCDLFHFKFEDLGHNRRHLLSPEQHKKFTKKATILFFLSGVGLLTILGICVWSMVIIVASAEYWEILLALPKLIMLFAVRSASKRQGISVEDVRGKGVRFEDGPLTLRTVTSTTATDQGGFSEEVLVYEINGHVLPSGGSGALFFGVPYRLYLLPTSSTLISVEALDAPRRH